MNALLVLIVLIIGTFTAYIFFKREGPRIWEQPSQTNLNNVVENSNFFSRMSGADLKARGASTPDEYKARYKASLSSFSRTEMARLDSLVAMARKVLSQYNNISRIPWKIVKSSGAEGDMPHTIGDVIVLPGAFLGWEPEKQLEILVHEKIHVYQRVHPVESSKLYVSLGFKHWKQGRLVPLLRNNPDNDSSVYSLGGVAQAQVYSSEEPRSLADSAIKTLAGEGSWDLPVKQREHPNEVMACWIAEEVLGNGPQHAHKKTIQSWMNSFL